MREQGDLGDESALGSIGVDDQLMCLLAVDQGDRQCRQRVSLGLVGLANLHDRTLAGVTAAAERHADRHARPRPCVSGRVDIAHGDVARDPRVADRHDVDRHAERAVRRAIGSERFRVGRAAVGEDEDAERQALVKPRRELLECPDRVAFRLRPGAARGSTPGAPSDRGRKLNFWIVGRRSSGTKRSPSVMILWTA